MKVLRKHVVRYVLYLLVPAIGYHLGSLIGDPRHANADGPSMNGLESLHIHLQAGGDLHAIQGEAVGAQGGSQGGSLELVGLGDQVANELPKPPRGHHELIIPSTSLSGGYAPSSKGQKEGPAAKSLWQQPTKPQLWSSGYNTDLEYLCSKEGESG